MSTQTLWKAESLEEALDILITWLIIEQSHFANLSSRSFCAVMHTGGENLESVITSGTKSRWISLKAY